MPTQELMTDQQLKDLFITYKQRRKLNPLEWFTPNGAQEDRILMESFINVFSTGNGVGKSALGCNWVGTLIFGPQAPCFRIEPYFTFPRPSAGRIVSTATNIEKNLVPELKKWFPPKTYTTAKGRHLYASQWTFNNESTFHIMTYEQDPDEFEGPTLNWIWFDEPPPEELWGPNISRLRKGGLVLITMTPLTQAGWIFDKINDPWVNQETSWSTVTADIEANCKQHGKNGVLEHKDIERMIAEYPPEERDARISGKPLYLEGRVYPTFSSDIHVVPHALIEKKLSEPCTLYMVVDPHDRKPFAIAWALVDPTGDVYWFDEWPNEPYYQVKYQLQLADYVDIIRSKEDNRPIETRLIDARYGNRTNVQTGRTIRDEFDEHGLTFHNSYTDQDASISAGHIKVRQYLHYDPKLPISETNKPKMYFSDRCLNLIYGMLHYTYDNYRRKELGVKERPKQNVKDFPDLVRYLAMDEPEHYERVEEISEEPIPDRWAEFAEITYA
jgi:phage terminase large subunit-like protein